MSFVQQEKCLINGDYQEVDICPVPAVITRSHQNSKKKFSIQAKLKRITMISEVDVILGCLLKLTLAK